MTPPVLCPIARSSQLILPFNHDEDFGGEDQTKIKKNHRAFVPGKLYSYERVKDWPTIRGSDQYTTILVHNYDGADKTFMLERFRNLPEGANPDEAVPGWCFTAFKVAPNRLDRMYNCIRCGTEVIAEGHKECRETGTEGVMCPLKMHLVNNSAFKRCMKEYGKMKKDEKLGKGNKDVNVGNVLDKVKHMMTTTLPSELFRIPRKDELPVSVTFFFLSFFFSISPVKCFEL